MGSKSDAYEIDVLKATTGQATTVITTTPLAEVWVALYTVAPTDSTPGTEVTGGSYARTASKGKWAVPTAGSCANNAVITFPTATVDWGTVAAFALCTASTGGVQMMWGTLTASKAVNNGDTASFAASALTLTED